MPAIFRQSHIFSCFHTSAIGRDTKLKYSKGLLSLFTEEVLVKPMLSPAFSLNNTGSTPVTNAFFKIGVPCRKGDWRVTDRIQLRTASGLIDNSVCTPQLLWDDGSVRWLLAEGTYSLDAGQRVPISLCQVKATPFCIPSPISESGSALVVHCRNNKTVTLNKDSAGRLDINSRRYRIQVRSSGRVFTPTLKSQHYAVKTNEASVFSVDITQHGFVELEDDVTLELFLNVTVLLENGDCHFQATLRNPSAAAHPDGQWDLGDPNSVFIDECYLETMAPAKAIRISSDQDTIEPEGKNFNLHQASSGLSHWNSPVHVDGSGEVNLPFQGYEFSLNGSVQARGKQATPTVEVAGSSDFQYITFEHFWENFPSAIRGNQSSTYLSLLGALDSPETEIQPGEQKTRYWHITSASYSALHVTHSPDYVAATQCLPFSQAHDSEGPIQKLIQKGIEGDNTFFDKREAIDEFGWRHFGELYADHEKALTPEVQYFVSHYNNQYDPVSGLINQWLTTADERWLTLADQLTRHVADIDVYHTSDDKPEYSGGLFWHTDHYVQAFTATHRTYSKRQPTDVYDDHAGGGGPGGQHCYTNGLLLHYLLTGNPASKDALLSVCEWIETYYDGDRTGIGFLLALKNSGTAGVKDVRTGQYPLDRGTGNYLQAMMDRYTLLGQVEDLNKCAHIIFNTVSPEDNLANRDLENIEETWFYTVFLQAVCRFIQIKESESQNDAAYAYAVRSLVHYANWMAKHEYAYLDKPDILEFPNQTWTGQDLRKLCVLHFARHYMEQEQAKTALRKADELLAKIESRLSGSEESQTTRVLCLMMQNANYDAYGKAPQPMTLKEHYPSLASLTTPTLRHALLNTLRDFSLKRERHQAVKRFPVLQKWLGKP